MKGVGARCYRLDIVQEERGQYISVPFSTQTKISIMSIDALQIVMNFPFVMVLESLESALPCSPTIARILLYELHSVPRRLNPIMLNKVLRYTWRPKIMGPNSPGRGCAYPGLGHSSGGSRSGPTVK